jgi:hypothetical protein
MSAPIDVVGRGVEGQKALFQYLYTLMKVKYRRR